MDDLTDEDRVDGAGADRRRWSYVGVVEQVKRSFVHRYRFPPQEHAIEVGTAQVRDPGERRLAGRGRRDRRRRRHHRPQAEARERGASPTSLVPYDLVERRSRRRSLLRDRRSGWPTTGSTRTGRTAPRGTCCSASRRGWARRPARRSRSAGELVADGRGPPRHASSTRRCLAIQGPPGLGQDVHRAPDDPRPRARPARGSASPPTATRSSATCWTRSSRGGRGTARRAVRIGQKTGQGRCHLPRRRARLDSNDAVAGALAAGELDVVGGTAWLWARDGVRRIAGRPVRGRGRPDVAGERASPSRRPPTRSSCSATRSSWTSRSRARTRPAPSAPRSPTCWASTRRCRPSWASSWSGRGGCTRTICAYTSEAFYEGALEPEAGHERQVLAGAAPLDGTGIRFVAVPPRRERHRVVRGGGGGRGAGRARCSTAGATWIDVRGRDAPLRPARTSSIVTPYNAQVARDRRSRAARRPRRHRGQVPGPGGARLDLLDGHAQLGRRRAARHGVPLQPQPAQRGHLTGPLRHGRRGQPRPPARPLPHAAPDAPRQRALPPRGDGRGLIVAHAGLRGTTAAPAGPTRAGGSWRRRRGGSVPGSRSAR